MSEPFNILLHSPVNDIRKLSGMVKQWLEAGTEIVACWGQKCMETHDLVDDIIFEHRGDQPRNVLTTWHEKETLEDVIEFVEMWYTLPVREVRV